MLYVGIDYSITSPAFCIGKSGDAPNQCHYYAFCDKVIKNLPSNYTLMNYPKWRTPEERFDLLSDSVLINIQKYKISKVYLEGYAYGGSGKVFEIAENCGLLKHKLRKHRIDFEVFAPSAVKKTATGKGNANKQDLYDAWVRAYGLKIQDIISPKAKNIGNPVSDIVDSYFIMKHGITLSPV